MQFVVLRILRQSEIGWFGEVRRQKRETSRQRAVTFDSVSIDRLFPAAGGDAKIDIELSRRDDNRSIATQQQILKRQQKNWRLTGPKIDDTRFGFVQKGDLLVMRIDTADPPSGAFDVLPQESPGAKQILQRPEASQLATSGLIALHPSEAGPIPQLLAELDEELFGSLVTPSPTDTPQPSAPEGDLLVIPSPDRMFQIVGNLGHTLPIAVADLIDNSISARATRVEVNWPSPEEGERWLSIVDNGTGMDRSALLEAMRFGSSRTYEDRDLGKFGIGLKSASFSQARILTVASRTATSEPAVLRWDRDKVGNGRDWEVIEPQLEEWEQRALLGPLQAGAGTVVLWDEVLPPRAVRRRRSRKSSSTSASDGAYGRALHELSLHLSMVFHRFIQGNARSDRSVDIILNGQELEAWDPFLRDHSKTRALSGFAESLPVSNGADCPVQGRPYVLPHKAQFVDDSAWRRAGYDGQWNTRQGLYIYRADRLIQAGGWCELWQPDEHTKLLRVALSFDPELDDFFEVNVAKMAVTLPPQLARVLKAHLKTPRSEARRRYKREGKKSTRSSSRSSANRSSKIATTPVKAPIVPPRPRQARAEPPKTQPEPSEAREVRAPAATAPQQPSSAQTSLLEAARATAPAAKAPPQQPARPRFIRAHHDGSRPWRVESTLLGGKDVRLDLSHSLGQLIAETLPTDSALEPVLAALIVLLEEKSVTSAEVASLVTAWQAPEKESR